MAVTIVSRFVFSVILAPMIMFGYAMKYAVLINPLVYLSEGMRAALTPSVPHMPNVVLLAALVLISGVFLWLGLRSFDRRAIS